MLEYFPILKFILNKYKKLNSYGLKSGFSLLEVIVTISFLMIILAIGVGSFRDTALDKELESTANNIVSTLELARTNSVAGKNSQNYGVKFNNDSYISFVGSSYIESNESNETNTVGSKVEITTDIPGASESVVFSKITGQPNHGQELTITISEKNESDNNIDVVIGILGEISVIK